MAMSHAKATVEALAVQRAAEQVCIAYDMIVALLAHNSSQAIDWGGDPAPVYLQEDAGNLAGLHFSRQQVANAIGSFDAFRVFMTANGNAHLGNINLVARPAGQR